MHSITYKKIVIPILLLLCGASVFRIKRSSDLAKEDRQGILIVTTTNILADIIKNIVQGKADVIPLMKAGVDPHAYDPTFQDRELLSKADIIIYNGLHLEGQMHEPLQKMNQMKPVYAFSNTFCKEDILYDPDFEEGGQDPHFWLSVDMVIKGIPYIVEMLSTHMPVHQESYRKNGSLYQDKLVALDTKIKDVLHQLPSHKRILLVAHDSFAYFGRDYNIEVKGVLPISTMNERGLSARLALQDFIVEKDVKFIFAESSVNDKHVWAIIEGCKVTHNYVLKVAGPLFSDSLGAPGKPEGTYIGMMETNLQIIASLLNDNDENN